MNKIVKGLFFLFLISNQLRAQIFPKEGSKLNYRIIGFSFPSQKQSSKYTIEIANGDCNSEGSFKKNIIKTFSSDTNKIIGEVPSFGKKYTWRIVYTNKKSSKTKSKLYHFSTGIILEVDTSINRLRIIKRAEKYKDAYVFIDDTRTLYDMDGKPVWYVPDMDGPSQTNDLKITPFGTITFLYGSRRGADIYEINYDGAVLWKGPDMSQPGKYRVQRYHHQFSRLANGHYMVLGAENIPCKLPSARDSSFIISTDTKGNNDSNETYQDMQFETVIEFDEQGNVVWLWEPMKYLSGYDLHYRKTPNGIPDVYWHENAFFFDERVQAVYVSLKEVSRIIKIKYPEGNVMSEYGSSYKPGAGEKRNDLFCGQHCCLRSEKGYLYLFNNNDCNSGQFPKIIMMEEPLNAKDSLPTGQAGLKKIWEYECTNDDLNEAEKKNLLYGSGGSVLELPDHSIFGCVSGNRDIVFIVSPDKKILWSAYPERKDNEGNWRTIPQLYKASMITKEEMLRLIWHK